MNIDVHKAMLNSYYLIIRDYDPFLLITQGDGVFAHNPSGELDREEVENMLLYFEDEEDYDKCREIVEFIDRTWSLENTKKK
jgi:hypothetical protein|tara:strand:- start:680 stop:925 length:246 start_codon:yes stop_codon:yes gene_type:complete